MKRIFITLVFLMVGEASFAQLRVVPGSFKLIPDDLRGQIEMKEDDNGYKCSVLKIKTINISEEERVKFRFSADAQTQIVEYQFQIGEIWVWLTADASMIRFQHPDLSTLRFDFPYSIEPKRTYEITIENVKNEPDKPIITEEFLDMQIEPKDALVMIDGNPVMPYDGVVSKLLKIGEHTYKVSSNMYHEESGTFTITAEGKTVKNISLKPAFGYLSISSTPESDAVVYIGGEMKGKTPYRSDKLKSGSYNVLLVKDMYSHTVEPVVVEDGKTTEKTLKLSPNFAQIEIVSDKDADIYINSQFKAKGRWSGRLAADVYSIEARKASHRTTKKSMTVTAGKNETVTLENPEPIYGSLNIVSVPPRATITIDGKDCGTTPQIVRNLLIGSHVVALSKEGCTPMSKNINIEEGKTFEMNETLPTGKDIAISSEPSGASVYVDGTYAGLTPINISMSFGSHNVKVTKDGEEKTQTINVSEYGNSSWSFDVRKKPKGTYTVNGVTFEMVAVEGGTFTMGCTNEQGSDCYDSEKPSHRVTLSNYMIGKYEVTQELWQAVMGSNPSYFKGNKNPVEQVSWNDVQEFITKLNQLTGQNFRLPTEAEWEYAARGGNKSGGYKYSGSNTLRDVAWFGQWNGNTYDNGNSGEKTHPVGTKSPNELGIYDMSGNVWEWCQDWYGSYSSGSETNPKGPSSGSSRVSRGGGWNDYAGHCRVSYRGDFTPGRRYYNLGFRLASQ